MYGTQAVCKVLNTGTVFENDVKMYGTQACVFVITGGFRFENDVKMYGTQASGNPRPFNDRFEKDVKMYGIQAPFPSGGKLSRSHVGLFSQVIVPVSCDPGR